MRFDPKLESCQFICISDIPFTVEFTNALTDSDSITFGDANRTLVTAERLLQEVDIENEEDSQLLERLIEKYGDLCYIDISN